jgi:hypothetical protein
MKSIWCLLLVSGWSSLSLGKELRRTFEDTRFMGHGEAGIASVSGISSLYYNPAGLAFGSNTLRSFSILDPQITVSEDVLDGIRNPEKFSQLNVNAEQILGQFENHSVYLGAQDFAGGSFGDLTVGYVGGAYANVSLGLLDVNLDKSQVLLEAVTHHGVVVGHGREIWKNLYVGAGVKLLEKHDIYYPNGGFDLLLDLLQSYQNKEKRTESLRSLLRDGKGLGIGADLGMIYKQPMKYIDMSYGLSLQDVGDTAYRGELVRSDKQMVSVGTTMEATVNQQDVKASFDYIDLLNRNDQVWGKHALFGVEVSHKKLAGVSMGLHQGYPVAGAWVSLWVVTAEYSYTVSDVGDRLGEFPSYRQSVHVRLGWEL